MINKSYVSLTFFCSRLERFRKASARVPLRRQAVACRLGVRGRRVLCSQFFPCKQVALR
eukprot:Skav205086  [mRNA]  locus=scaffold5258:8651:8827:- [translate_table: standard]